MTGFIFEDPVSAPPQSIGQGEASFWQVWNAARDSAVYGDNLNAKAKALEEAYDRRIDAVKRATGVELTNPLRDFSNWALTQSSGAYMFDKTRREDFETAFRQQLGQLQSQYPDKARDIRAAVPVLEDAKQIARAAGEKFAAAMASRSDFAGKWTAALGGGFAGSLRDPIQTGTIFVGGGAGAGRTAIGRVLATAAREAVVNGTLEAAQQPIVQDWRAEAGLPHGMEQATFNVLAAAGFAGALGGIGASAHEGLARLLRPHGERMPADARGALMAEEADAAMTAARPSAMPAGLHDENLSRAMDAAENGTPFEMVQPKRQQWNNRPATIMEFMAERGGLRDDDGVLTAMGLNSRNSFTKFGPGYRKPGEAASSGGGLFGNSGRFTGAGRAPDEMREALVEAGYLPEGATVADMYQAIERHQGGETQVPLADAQWQADVEARRQALAADDELDARYEPHEASFIRDHGWTAFEDLRQAGIDIKGVDPDDAAMARQIMDETGATDFLDAFERAVMRNADNLTRRVADEAEINDIPFFNEADNAGLSGDGAALRAGGEGDQIGGGAGGVREERQAGAAAGADRGSPFAEGWSTGEPAGGVDDVTAPEVHQQTDDLVSGLKAQREKMIAEGALPPDYPTIDEALKEATRAQELADLVAACKAV